MIVKNILLSLCILLTLAILALGIMAAVIGSQFKVPSYELSRLRIDPKNPLDIQKDSFKTVWLADISIKNDNFFDIFITSLETRLYLKNVPDNGQLGQGQLNDFNLPKNERTNITMSIKVGVDSKQDPQVLQTLLGSCVPNGKKLPLNVQTDVRVKLFGIGPFAVPTVQTESQLECPATIKNIISDIASNIIPK